MKRGPVPPDQQCAFCAERWLFAIGGQRLCAKHEGIVEDIARDAGVPVHITVHRLTRDESKPGPELVGDLLPGVMAEILANQKLPPRSTVSTSSTRER